MNELLTSREADILQLQWVILSCEARGKKGGSFFPRSQQRKELLILNYQVLYSGSSKELSYASFDYYEEQGSYTKFYDNNRMVLAVNTANVIEISLIANQKFMHFGEYADKVLGFHPTPNQFGIVCEMLDSSVFIAPEFPSAEHAIAIQAAMDYSEYKKKFFSELPKETF